MKIIEEFPNRVVEEENVWIPGHDGTKLAARIWRPDNSDDAPVPVILEYIPYRKRFGTIDRDEMTHKFLAGHGYACVRLDIRGSGESEGVLTDEYLQSELDDGVSAIEWLARQPWSTGKVGMMGISWGGFNGLQIAALRPPALKAIISVSSSDDRYADDIHHMGGALLGDNLSWASVMFSFNSMPPDPAIVGDRWRDMWRQRLDESGLWLKTWLQHQRRDEYWRHGSVCEHYDAIDIPVFAVSGWADGYTNTVFRLMEHLKGPRKGLVGPWGHTYPHLGRPGPAIDFLSEAVKWWDRWLKDEPNGVESGPRICAYLQDSAPPNPSEQVRKGRWIVEEAWPPPENETVEYQLDLGRHLAPKGEDARSRPLDVQSPVTLGLFGGKWCSYANGPDLAGDQRTEDGGGLVFQTDPLEEEVEVFGAPEVELTLAADCEIAMVAVRLSDMRPDHQVTRVTYGLLNLTHRESRQYPEQLTPGEKYTVRVPLNYIAQSFPKGHRIRIAISTVYWPLAWTPPRSTRLTIWTGESRLFLPVRKKSAHGGDEAEFDSPVGAAGPRSTIVSTPEHAWTVKRDLGKKLSQLCVIDDRGVVRYEDIDLTVGARAEETYSAVTGDFTSVRGETEWVRTLRRDDWSIMTRTRTCLRSDRDYFYIDAELDAHEGESRFACKSWSEKIARDHL